MRRYFDFPNSIVISWNNIEVDENVVTKENYKNYMKWFDLDYFDIHLMLTPRTDSALPRSKRLNILRSF